MRFAKTDVPCHNWRGIPPGSKAVRKPTLNLQLFKGNGDVSRGAKDSQQ
jgi:hypothetical protein